MIFFMPYLARRAPYLYLDTYNKLYKLRWRDQERLLIEIYNVLFVSRDKQVRAHFGPMFQKGVCYIDILSLPDLFIGEDFWPNHIQRSLMINYLWRVQILLKLSESMN